MRFLLVILVVLYANTTYAITCSSSQYHNNGTCTDISAGYYGRIGLPDEYTELEYLESTGTQWIDTGVYVDSMDIRATIDFQYTNLISNTWFAGAVVMSGSTLSSMYGTEAGIVKTDSFYSGLGGSYSQNDTSKRTIVNLSVTRQAPNRNLYLFARNFYIEEDDEANVKIFSATLYDGDTVLRDFIPARHSDGTLGMYDIITGVFYTNAGTGTFVAGPVANTFFSESVCEIGFYCLNGLRYKCGTGTYSDTIGATSCQLSSPGFYTIDGTKYTPAGYTVLDYLESTGTQVIDTGVFIDSTNLRANIEFQFTENKNNTWIAGAMTSPDLLGIEGGIFYNHLYTEKGCTYSSSEIIARQTATIKVDSIPNKNLYIFGRNFPIEEDDKARARVFGVQIYDGDMLIRNLIPVQRDSDAELGLYDTINGVFYTNIGTGTFVAGTPITEYRTGATGQEKCPNEYSSTAGATSQSACYKHCDIDTINNGQIRPVNETVNYPTECEYNIKCDEGYNKTAYNTCNSLCGTGITTLRASTGIIVPLFAKKNTTPSINIKYNDTICYADLVEGQTTNAIHVQYNSHTYHTTN